jgi:dolichyl-phosphate beta-glucosyltransferase
MRTPTTDAKTPTEASWPDHTSHDSPTTRTDGPAQRNDMLSVVVPAYNEEQAIRDGLLAKIVSWKEAQPFPVELIVVDDGSEDATAQVAAGVADGVIRIEHGGKAAALTAGIRAATGSLVLLTDMDQATPIHEADKLLQAIVQSRCDIALGSRGLVRPASSLMRRAMSLGHWGFRKLLVRLPIVDTQCGFKLAKRNALLDILDHLVFYSVSKGHRATRNAVNSGFDVEVLVVGRLLGYTACEVPVSWHHKHNTRLSPLHEAAEGILDLARIGMTNYRKEWKRAQKTVTNSTVPPGKRE